MDDRGVAVVIEDDDDIRSLLSALLTQSGFAVHEAGSGSAGVDAVAQHDPVIVTVDLGLPDIDGFEVTRRIRRMTDAYVIVLTARTDEMDTLMVLDAGADEYVTKPFRPRELRARIEALLRRPRASKQADVPEFRAQPVPVPALTPRTAPSAPHVSDVAGDEFFYELDGLKLYPALYKVTAEDREPKLTPTEFILLRTLLASGRSVRSKTELFRVLRDEEPGSGTFVSEADERTVEVHMGNLRRKLGDDPRRARWVETLRGVGYRMTGMAQRRNAVH